MKTVIYYFSGTGNSLAVARHLAQGLPDCELAPMAKALRNPAACPDADRIGLVFPVYMWGPPLLVAQFARTMPFSAGQYIFAVCTCGGSPGSTLLRLGRMLQGRGATLAAGFSVKMPGNYIPMYGAPSAARQQNYFSAAQGRVNEIVACVGAQERRAPERSFFLLNWLFCDLVYRFSAPHIPAMDKSFNATPACNGCGLCAKVCLAQNIVLTNDRPVWRHRCQQCFACLQWCPQEAIEYGKRTRGRARYRHPDVKLQDLIIT
jgi:Fe-S-cluster-containing hydrogenase component 2